MQARSTLESMAPKVRSRSRQGVSLNEAPRISPRVSSKLASSASLSLSSVIAALARTAACSSATTTFSRASASSLSTSKPDKGRPAEGLEEALRYDAWALRQQIETSVTGDRDLEVETTGLGTVPVDLPADSEGLPPPTNAPAPRPLIMMPRTGLLVTFFF